jgi:hypothetical protein
VEALRRRKEREDETQVTTRIGGKTSLGRSYLFGYVKFQPKREEDKKRR